MKLYSYGEDALTLWALKERLEDIIGSEKDNDPIIFYRPSFGRSGGESSSQFGEFDFIIITKNTVYLGESKWDKSPEYRDDTVTLSSVQINRHKVMKEYIEGIFQYNKPIVTWKDFKEVMQGRISINIPNKDSLLAKNLTTILNKIYVKTNGTMPRIQNSLLILLKENNENVQSSSSEFKLIPIIYSKDLEDNFILQNI